jgi:hypothetical protein
MPARLVRIADLQPTDTLRVESVRYLETLPITEMWAKHGIPQVWKINQQMIISDGNQRLATLAKRGEVMTHIDYYEPGKVPAAESEFLQIITERAEQLRKRGVYSPLDLWQA